MGSFRFDYTKAAGKAAAGADQPEDVLEATRPKARQSARAVGKDDAGTRRPEAAAGGPAESPAGRRPAALLPHVVIRKVPPSMAVSSKDGKAFRFRLRDDRSDTNVGYLSVSKGRAVAGTDGLTVDLGTEEKRMGSYWLVRSGRPVRQDDKLAAIRDRVYRQMELAERHRQAERMDVPGTDRERGEGSWQKT